jgi:hypothetical protein
MKYLILGFLIVFLGENLSAQTKNTATGKVSYLSSQNIYVKFESTKNISPGDTLFMADGNVLIPVLIVTNLSSTSCVCTSISNANFTISSQVMAKNKVKPEIEKKEKAQQEIKVVKKEKILVLNDTTGPTTDTKPKQSEFKQKINGSISASSYTYFSNLNTVYSNRFQYNLSLNAMNIGNSRISVESYISFRHEKNKWYLVQDNIFQALKIYGLSIKFDINKNTQLSIGRKINPKMSSIGAVDGLQFEKRINNFYLGAVAGTRPNFTDYNFDPNLPQYGAYIAHICKNSMGEMQNSVGFIEQMSGTKTDRRFAYFQQTNSLIKNLYFFGSVELELYKNLNDKPQNTLSLSSSYLSLSYRMFRRLSLSVSYDSRKNVIYYETYKSYINQILETEARQGMSFQVNYNTLKNISIGVRTGYRFENNNSKANKNIYGYITYSNIPGLKISTTIAATYLETSYINGQVLNANISHELFQGKIYADAGYQHVDYKFPGFETSLIQNIANLNLSWRLYKNLTFSVNFEETFEKQNKFSRLNLQIRKRF